MFENFTQGEIKDIRIVFIITIERSKCI